ncbi:MAG: hypothetical protein BWK73_40520 [Thiothrix lacustris]|uniref:Sulfatase-modifying factor enzyme-like domain-containing protein n=1 Tax=Thiothrix lacustris TaxID=525917 RepID=A0A1Y1QDE8_9GAMM|nr:MAG: hypothetical protein BWK73_40520 [Thiothrix lacustris]
MRGITRLSKAVSRAELVQWLMQSGEDATSLQQIAALAGFEWQEKPLLTVEKVQKEPKRGEDKQIPLVQLEDKPPIPVLPQAPKVFNARWFCVAKRELLSQQDDNDQSREPLSIQGIEDFSAQDLQPGSTPPLALAPLLRWERLWPVLKQSFSSTMPGAIDIPRLVGRVARGGLVDSLPRQQRPHWAAESLILLDYNPRVTVVWNDFNRLVEQLKQLRGGAGLQVLKQQGLPGLRYARWRDKDKRQIDWVMPAPETPVLILSDLGMLEPSGSLRKHWLRFGRELKAAGLQPFVLAPVSPQHIDPELSRYYHIALWDRSSRLLRQQQRAETDNKAQLEQLLALLSPASRIEPELLRAVRHLLADTAFDAGLEAEFWQHPAVDKSPIACALRSESAETYRQQFKEQPPELQREVLKLIRQHHAPLFPSVMHYETLLWSVLAAKLLVQEFNAEIEQAELFLRKTAKMLYLHRDNLDDSRKAYGKRILDNAHEELLRKYSCFAVFEGSVNVEQLAQGMPLRLGIDWLELERTLASGDSTTRDCVLYQHGDELVLEEKGVSQFGSFISEFTITNDTLVLQVETLNGQITREVAYREADFYRNRRVDGVFVTHLEQNIKTIILQSGNEKLVLDSFTKPDWAHRIGRDAQGLWIEFTQNNKNWRVWWPAWGGDLGYDEYGLYTDLHIKGIIQRCRWIAPGTFLMGSPKLERGRNGDEKLHQVMLSDFWLADTTCTQALWKTIMNNDPSEFTENQNNPVEKVSWTDVQEFIDKLNKMIIGVDASLPNEAQWEYACRAGTQTLFSFGNHITLEQANYIGSDKNETGFKKTVPVKSFPANQWGLYEMHGNVREWCQDEYLKNYSKQADIESDSEYKVQRGGSWRSNASEVRSAARSSFHYEPSGAAYWGIGGTWGEPENDMGFRFILKNGSSVIPVVSHKI